MSGMVTKQCFILLSAVLFLAACEKTDTTGQSVPKAPATAPATSADTTPRIVSTVPAATLNLVLIGAADRLVGVTKYDQIYLPEAQRDLPVVGDYETMNYEKLVSLHPSAVIVQMNDAMISQRTRDLAAQYHFDLVNIQIDTLDDLWKTVGVLGHISGRDAAAAKAVLLARAELKEIADAVAGQPRPKVVYVTSRDPMYIAGAKTFLDQMVTLAGGDNVGAKVGTLFPVISNETLVKLAPDVLLIGAPISRTSKPTIPASSPGSNCRCPLCGMTASISSPTATR